MLLETSKPWEMSTVQQPPETKVVGLRDSKFKVTGAVVYRSDVDFSYVGTQA